MENVDHNETRYIISKIAGALPEAVPKVKRNEMKEAMRK